MKKITKEEFLTAYNKYPAKGWVKWAFKYFSKSTEKENMKLSNTVAWILGSLFLVGFLSTAFKFPRAIIGTVTITYSICLGILVLFLFAAVLSNNARIKKIAKELSLTLEEYNELVGKLFH